MDDVIESDDDTYVSDWSGSATPPLLDTEDDILASQCVVPQRKVPHNELDVLADASGKLIKDINRALHCYHKVTVVGSIDFIVEVNRWSYCSRQF